MSASKAWFGHRRYGVGFSPRSWEGWLSTLVFIVLICVGLQLILERGLAWPFRGLLGFAWVAVMLGAFVALVWIKRDRTKPVKFRWGSDS